MKEIQIFYGTDTGNTDHVVHEILIEIFKNKKLSFCIKQVQNLTQSDWTENTHFILGVPTWYDGDLQSDWEDYFETFCKIDFKNKKIALFGLGDQMSYDEWFIDGVGILAEIILKNGGEIYGNWPTETYSFEKSKAVMTDKLFYGLALDEDNQFDVTEVRCEQWINQLIKESFFDTVSTENN